MTMPCALSCNDRTQRCGPPRVARIGSESGSLSVSVSFLVARLLALAPCLLLMTPRLLL
jgi:hypothetical protein